MASSKEYLDYIMDQISHAEDVSYRPMMGEFIIYCTGKVVGGVYDDRFLVKPTASAKRAMPDGRYEKPYDGAKDMLLVENLDNKEFLKTLLERIAEDLPDKMKK